MKHKLINVMLWQDDFGRVMAPACPDYRKPSLAEEPN
jgi:hypothetical protein